VGRAAQAATGEPILFLGIQRHTAIDRVASDQLIDYLGEHGEIVLKSVALHENERRCRHPSCLEALGNDHRAALVLSGDVSSTGPNNTLRVQVRLYDVRRRGTEAAQAEMENLCVECDETKLGILLAKTATDLIASHRRANPNPPPPLGTANPPAAPPVPTPSIYGAPPPEQAPPVPLTMSIPPAQNDVPPPSPAQQAPTTQQQTYPQPYLGPEPQAQNPVGVPSTAPVTAAGPRKGLSRNRKIIAGVFGALGIGSLVIAAVMTGMDRRLAPDYSYDPDGRACTAPENMGKTCVLSTVGLYAPLYAVGGLLVGGMALTLALPESRPRPPPPPQDGTP
jgi:hypothetical protein